jgi:transcriptional regulator with XRE-family HTH domain
MLAVMSSRKKRTPGEVSRRVAARLDSARLAAGMSQTTLGKLSGISQSRISVILRAELPADIDELHALCVVLGLDFRTVMDGAVE